MLAADKLYLQSTVKQRATALREKELNLFNTNFSAVGAQAAIMAGFTLTTFVEIDLPPNKPTAVTMLHTFVVISICSNLMCVATVTFVSVWGSGKALRGKDGSMDIAVDGMNAERTMIFAAFAIGTLACLGCLFSAAWVLMETEVRRSPLPASPTPVSACDPPTPTHANPPSPPPSAPASARDPPTPTPRPRRRRPVQIAIVASVLVLSTMYLVCSEARRIRTLFYLEPDDCISFEELADVYPAFEPARAAAPEQLVDIGSSPSQRASAASPALSRSASGARRTNRD